jgi:hypothetical protein
VDAIRSVHRQTDPVGLREVIALMPAKGAKGAKERNQTSSFALFPVISGLALARRGIKFPVRVLLRVFRVFRGSGFKS